MIRELICSLFGHDLDEVRKEIDAGRIPASIECPRCLKRWDPDPRPVRTIGEAMGVSVDPELLGMFDDRSPFWFFKIGFGVMVIMTLLIAVIVFPGKQEPVLAQIALAIGFLGVLAATWTLAWIYNIKEVKVVIPPEDRQSSD